MGLIEGETLAQILAGGESRLDLSRLLRPVQQVCQAVGHAHACGVVHRDLKPENVIIGSLGVVKVIDWGIAVRLEDLEEGEPEGALIFGTPAYLPPEQANAGTGRIDERADVFSLGGILCEILTGEPPYAGEDQDQVLARACAADLHDAHRRLDVSGADHELVALAKRCLEANPAHRPKDAGEVEAAVQEYLASGLRRFERDQVRFFELCLDLFCIAGLDGYFRQINANFSKVLGFAEQELLKRPFVEFVHPDDVERTIKAVDRLQAGRKVVGFSNRYRRVDGTYVRLEWSARAIPEEGVIYAVARLLS